MLRLDLLERAPLTTDPFEFTHVEGFLDAGDLAAVNRDYPAIRGTGSFPVDVLEYGPAFADLLAELKGPRFRSAVEQKFAIELADRPIMITARGWAGRRDGFIHTDSVTKLITVLLYTNERWERSEGCLRLLYDGEDLDRAAFEVTPSFGNLLVFRRSERSFHGHLPANEPRRSLQLNWMVDRAARDRELARHRRTAWIKRLNPFA